MKTVALATYSKLPDLNEDDRLFLPHLDKRGIAYEIHSWRARDVDWRRFDAVVIRSTWDYFIRFDDFRAWIERLEADSECVFNSTEVIRWNWNKRYLAELEKKGVAIVPTLWASRPKELEDELEAAEWDELVLKPSVSAGAHHTYRVKRGELAAVLPKLGRMSADEPYLAQPFLPQIQTEGEYSFLYFNGQFSHSILKKPASGDFRVQHTHGGTIVAYAATKEELAQAGAALAASARDTLYARVDMIRADDGRLWLVELELIEPHFYLGSCVGAPERFASALAERLR